MSNPPRILVVDDNMTVVDMLQTMLRQMGYEVLCESDGKVAIRTARHEHPDLILIDMRLPGMDGLEAVRQMRRHDELESTPIVALTGYAGVMKPEAAMEAGCDAFFAKPFDLRELRGTVRELLSDSGSTRSPAPSS